MTAATDDGADNGGALWQRLARAAQGEDYAHRYAERFDELAASGRDVHGEAHFLQGLLPAGARVLDAGCGTGRVTRRLHELGFSVVGVDVDPAMVQVARERTPELDWRVADLAVLDLGTTFDLVVSAGNVVPLVGPATVAAVVDRLTAHLRSGGLLVAGFGVDAGHLPSGVPVVGLPTYDAACAVAGLALRARFADWDGAPYEGGGYAVSVHEATAGPGRPDLAENRA